MIQLNSPKITSLLSAFLLCAFTLLSSCVALQYGIDTQKNSQFSTFDDLGIDKEEFIRQYGLPTSKSLYNESGMKIETLYYTERVRGFLVTTEFHFVNNVLKRMEKYRIENDLQGQIDDIQQRVR